MICSLAANYTGFVTGAAEAIAKKAAIYFHGCQNQQQCGAVEMRDHQELGYGYFNNKP